MAILKPKSPENAPKNSKKRKKNSNLLKTKRILNTDV